MTGILVKEVLWEAGSQLSYRKYGAQNASAKPMFGVE